MTFRYWRADFHGVIAVFRLAIPLSIDVALQGAFILILHLCLPQVWLLIPTASLSSALVHAGARLVDFSFPASLWRTDLIEGCVYLITMTLVFSTDMLTGIAVGVALSLSRFALSRANSC